MTYRSYNRYNGSVHMQSYFLDGGNSSRVNGKLILKPQRLLYDNVAVTSYMRGSDPEREFRPSDAGLGSMPDPLVIDWDPIDNICRAKFNGKLKHDKAALGLTFFTWKQSLAMITEKLTLARNVLGRAERRLVKDKRFRRRSQKWDKDTTSANRILEVEFGWKPLFEDVKSALTVLASDIPDQYITARHKVYVSAEKMVSQTLPNRYRAVTGTAQVTYSSQVTVTNHNLWLLNKLGLINPVAVAWDAIPWSFLVSMFSNANQLVASLTDTVGLSLDNENVTRTTNLRCIENLSYYGYDWEGGTGRTLGPYLGFSAIHARRKTRDLGTRPKLSFEFRAPKDVSLETVAIAGGLLVQQAARISRLITR